MSLEPFFAAAPHIKAHIIAASSVIVLTPTQFLPQRFMGFRKGSLPHQTAGYLWLGAMLVLAGTSFFIPSTLKFSFMGFSPIHLLSVWTVISVGLAIYFARNHRVMAHRKVLILLSIGFLIAGAFTLIPPRIMGRIFWG